MHRLLRLTKPLTALRTSRVATSRVATRKLGSSSAAAAAPATATATVRGMLTVDQLKAQIKCMATTLSCASAAMPRAVLLRVH